MDARKAAKWLDRLHTHGEKAADTASAIDQIARGAVTFIGGLRTLLDIVSPRIESDKD